MNKSIKSFLLFAIVSTISLSAIGQTVTATVRTSHVFYRLGTATIIDGTDTGTPTNYYIGSDGNLYLSCYMGGNNTGNYLTLEPTGTPNQWVAHLPQLVYEEVEEGHTFQYFANRMEKENILYAPDSISYKLSTTAPNEITYTLSADGTLSMDETGVDVIMGLTYSDNSWTGFGDAHSFDVPVANQIVTLPEGAVTQTYRFAYEWANWPEYGRLESFINAAIVGNDIYINNPYNTDPEQWFRGRINGNTVTFDCGQLMGLDTTYDRYLYFRGGELTYHQEEYYSYSDVDQLVFTFDPTTNSIIENRQVSIYVSRGFGARGYNNNYDFPSITSFQEQVASLQDPSWYSIAELGTFDDFGYSYAQVSVAKNDSEGNVLNTDNLYYSIYIGDSPTPYVFSASDYTNDFGEDVTEIPFNYDGYDFYPFSPGSEIHTFFTYFSTDNLRMGVQAIYYDAEGTVHRSNIVYNNGSVGIEKPEIVKPYLNDGKYYNLLGQEVKNPTSGIYIHNGKKVFIH